MQLKLSVSSSFISRQKKTFVEQFLSFDGIGRKSLQTTFFIRLSHFVFLFSMSILIGGVVAAVLVLELLWLEVCLPFDFDISPGSFFVFIAFNCETLHILLCSPFRWRSKGYFFQFTMDTLEHHFTVPGSIFFLTPSTKRKKKRWCLDQIPARCVWSLDFVWTGLDHYSYARSRHKINQESIFCSK